ncbi:MAG: hypothetical protein D3924_00365, partial [Candidatus Electrothrix sp. AR4]|nr:hypothetical protein [Candidatus Electrothrix sp. AR4]
MTTKECRWIRNKSIPVILICYLFSAYWTAHLVFAASADEVQVTLGADESLRQISGRLLGEEDAWQLILLYNGIENINKAAVGTSLQIPVARFTELNTQLKRSASIISDANSEGAALLATEDIAEAVRLRTLALRLKKEARLDEAAQHAVQAVRTAQAALAKVKRTKIRSAEAWLSGKSGTVQNRPPESSKWENTELQQKLQERERIRTLADSRCRISFSDQSELTLDEYSLVTIGSMQKNVVRNSSNTSVSVIKGDILFHLASLNQRRQFKVTSPDVTTDIRSLHFLTSRDKSNITRIANYDGEIDIKASGTQVTVKKNQGTTVVPGRKPTPPKKLLPPPKLLTPTPDRPLHSLKLRFTWEPVPDALRYRVEISKSPDFKNILTIGKVNDKSFQWHAPTNGSYSFRIKTIDQDKQAGPYSEPMIFFI